MLSLLLLLLQISTNAKLEHTTALNIVTILIPGSNAGAVRDTNSLMMESLAKVRIYKLQNCGLFDIIRFQRRWLVKYGFLLTSCNSFCKLLWRGNTNFYFRDGLFAWLQICNEKMNSSVSVLVNVAVDFISMKACIVYDVNLYFAVTCKDKPCGEHESCTGLNLCTCDDGFRSIDGNCTSEEVFN